jgi:hypothetical protein
MTRMGDDFAMIVAVALAVVMVLGLAAGAVLMIRDTARKRGRWGINLRPVSCPEWQSSSPPAVAVSKGPGTGGSCSSSP